MTRRQMRIAIVTCLYQYLLTEKDLDLIFEDNLDLKDKESMPFIINNTVGVIENLDSLIEEINKYLKDWSFDRLGYVEQAILLLSAYQLKQGEIDRPIIINEAVEIAKKYCDDDAPKLINGVLDKIC